MGDLGGVDLADVTHAPRNSHKDAVFSELPDLEARVSFSFFRHNLNKIMT